MPDVARRGAPGPSFLNAFSRASPNSFTGKRLQTKTSPKNAGGAHEQTGFDSPHRPHTRRSCGQSTGPGRFKTAHPPRRFRSPCHSCDAGSHMELTRSLRGAISRGNAASEGPSSHGAFDTPAGFDGASILVASGRWLWSDPGSAAASDLCSLGRSSRSWNGCRSAPGKPLDARTDAPRYGIGVRSCAVKREQRLVGARLRALRKQREESLIHAAEVVGIHPNHLGGHRAVRSTSRSGRIRATGGA